MSMIVWQKASAFTRPFLLGAFVVLPCLSFAQKTAAGGGKTASAGGSQTAAAGGGAAQSGSSPYFETEMLAYGGANQIAYAIDRAICEKGLASTSRIIIYDQVSFQNLQAWQAFKAAATVLESSYQTITGTSSATSGTNVIGTATDFSDASASPASFFAGSDVSNLISALAATTTNTATTFTMPDSTAAIAILHAMPRACPSMQQMVYYPLKGDADNYQDAQKALSAVLKPVIAARTAAQKMIAAKKPADATKDVDYLVFSDLNTQYDQWMATLVTSVAQNQQPGQFAAGPNVGVTSILQGAEIERDLAAANTYILYANIVAAGGTQRDRKNIFSLFVGDFITYSGGLVVNFGLVSGSSTKVVMADVLRYRAPNTRLHDAHQILEVESTDSDDNLLSLCNTEQKKGGLGGIKVSNPKDCKVLTAPK